MSGPVLLFHKKSQIQDQGYTEFCKVCFPQCLHNSGKAHFGNGTSAGTFENCQKKRDSVVTYFDGTVSNAAFLCGKDSCFAIVESKLSSVHQISFELVRVHRHRNTCAFDRTSQRSQISKLTGAKLASFSCTFSEVVVAVMQLP